MSDNERQDLLSYLSQIEEEISRRSMKLREIDEVLLEFEYRASAQQTSMDVTLLKYGARYNKKRAERLQKALEERKRCEEDVQRALTRKIEIEGELKNLGDVS